MKTLFFDQTESYILFIILFISLYINKYAMIGIICIIIFLIFFYRIPDMQINMSKDILASPCSGKIIKIEEDNYRSRFLTHINTNYGMIEIIQNTGVLARRIKNNLKLNDNVKKGDILGIIKFGSRVDITIPKTFKLLKGLNDKVFIGDSFAKLI